MSVDQLHRLAVRQLPRDPPRDADELLVALEGSRSHQLRHEARCALEEGSDLRLRRLRRQAVKIGHLGELDGARLPLRWIELEFHQVAHGDAVFTVHTRHLGLELAIAVNRALVHARHVHSAPQVEADGVQVVVGGHQPEPPDPLPTSLIDRGAQQRGPRPSAGCLGVDGERFHLVVLDPIGEQANGRAAHLGDEARRLERIEKLAQASGHARALVAAQQPIRPSRVLGSHRAYGDTGPHPHQLPR